MPETCLVATVIGNLLYLYLEIIELIKLNFDFLKGWTKRVDKKF